MTFFSQTYDKDTSYPQGLVLLLYLLKLSRRNKSLSIIK